MMPREEDFITKQESNATNNCETSKASTTTSWSRFKDPRIVRVSKAFGGKDRHSKVCTVRGLRDRRVRLSVLTAIQLYDLQERLGLNQPSKVVDWLLDAAKHEIDELPPLQIPQGAFSQGLNPIHDFKASQSDKGGLKISGNFNWNDPLKLQPSTSFDGKSKDVLEETGDKNDADHQPWTRNEEQSDYVSTSDFLSRQNNPSSFSSLLSSTTPAPYNSLVRWDPSNLSLSHPPISLGLTEDLHNFNLGQLPSTTASVQPGSHQFLVYQPGINAQGYFPCQISPTNPPFDLKHPCFHTSDLSNSSTQPLRPFQFSMTADLLPSQSNDINEQNKHCDLHSS